MGERLVCTVGWEKGWFALLGGRKAGLHCRVGERLLLGAAVSILQSLSSHDVQ